jgi:hypothetical protein
MIGRHAATEPESALRYAQRRGCHYARIITALALPATGIDTVFGYRAVRATCTALVIHHVRL